jgi:hypothetical protein
MERKYMYGIGAFVVLGLLVSPVGAALLAYASSFASMVATITNPLSANGVTYDSNVSFDGTNVPVAPNELMQLNGTTSLGVDETHSLNATFTQTLMDGSANTLDSGELGSPSASVNGTALTTTCTNPSPTKLECIFPSALIGMNTPFSVSFTPNVRIPSGNLTVIAGFQ